MGEHLPALQVVLPLVAAPLIVLVGRRGFAWVATTAVSYGCLAIAIALAAKVAAGGTISYAIGSWPPPWGIEYRVDALSAFVLVLIGLLDFPFSGDLHVTPDAFELALQTFDRLDRR